MLVSLYSWSYLGNPLAFGQAYRAGGFSWPHAAWLAGLLVSPSRGLFVFSPVLLACLGISLSLFVGTAAQASTISGDFYVDNGTGCSNAFNSTSPGTPCARGPWMTKSCAGVPAGPIFGRMPV